MRFDQDYTFQENFASHLGSKFKIITSLHLCIIVLTLLINIYSFATHGDPLPLAPDVRPHLSPKSQKIQQG
jgi:hypothetical protein